MLPVSDVIPVRRTPWLTFVLLAVHAAGFGYELSLDAPELQAFATSWGIVPGAPRPLAFLTYGFVHDGPIHAAATLLYLWLFGPALEDRLGRGTWLLLHALGLAAGGVAAAWLHSSALVPVTGASAEVAAVLAAYLVVYPRSQVLIATIVVLEFDVVEIPAVVFLSVWLVVQLAAGLTSYGVQPAHPALTLAMHGAGALVGAFAGVAGRMRGWRWG